MALPTYRQTSFLDFSDPKIIQSLQESFAKVAAQSEKRYPMMIQGKEVWREKAFVSVNPNQPSQVLGRFPLGTVEDIDLAVTAAEDAFQHWKRVPATERVGISLRTANLFRKYRYDLNALLVLEVGKSWLEADAEVAEGIDHFEYMARQMLHYDQGKELVPFPGEINEYRYIPLGVGAVISPWNYPIGIAMGMISAAIIAGNTIVFKPSSDCPRTSYLLMKILSEAGVPDGVVNLVYGSGSLLGSYLARHPRVHFVGFTGSKEVGVQVAQQAGLLGEGQRWFKRVILELGGKNGIIVDESADLEEAADAIIAAAVGYQGQKCSACSRAIILKDVYDEMIHLLQNKMAEIQIGPVEQGNTVGAVINLAAKEKVLHYLEIGKQEASLLYGGEEIASEGYVIQPTIFTDVHPQARIAQEEIFGPVLSVIKADSFTEALHIANDTVYGLTGAVYTQNPHHLAKAKEEFHVGNLYLNRRNTGAWIGSHPFGGYNLSGTNSKLGGPDYLLQFMQPKLMTQKIDF